MARNAALRYALVAPCVALPSGGREAYTYHYEEREQSLPVGAAIRIPFGKRSITGIVLDPQVRRPPYPTKPISSVLEMVLTPTQIQYARQIAAAAHGGLGFTLRLFLP